MKIVIFSTLLSGTVLNCNARNLLIPDEVRNARTSAAARPNIIPLDLTSAFDTEEDEIVCLTALKARNAYLETLSGVDLVLQAQIQLSQFTCEPESCTALHSSCTGCRASFCMTNIDLVSFHPNRYQSFMEVADSDHCSFQSKVFDLDEIYTKVLESDSKATSNVRNLPIAIAIFEMGSTSSERLTKALSIDHTNIMFVNAQPLDEALMQCDDRRKQQMSKEPCQRSKVVDLVKKVGYLACRTTDLYYEQCIVKFLSESIQGVDIFEEAFRSAKSFFIYVEPEVFIGGAIIDPSNLNRAPCSKNIRNPSKAIVDALEKVGKESEDMTIAEICSLSAQIAMDKAAYQKEKNGRLELLNADTVMENITDIGGCSENPTAFICQNETLEAMKTASNTDIYGNVDPYMFEKRKEALLSRATPELRQAATGALFESFVNAGLKTQMPSLIPSPIPSSEPSKSMNPSSTPSLEPSSTPSLEPSNRPSKSMIPSQRESMNPSVTLSHGPSSTPSLEPSNRLSNMPSQSPSNEPTHCTGRFFTLNLYTDRYGSEISYKLIKNGEIIMTSVPGLLNNAHYNEVLCLSAGCHTFIITDAAGDGICCVHGSGYYHLFWNGVWIKGGGSYKLSEQTSVGCV